VLRSRKVVGRLVSLAAAATVADIMIEVTRHHKFSTVGWYIRVYVARIRHHFQGSLISFRLGHYFMIRFILQQRNIVDQQNHHSVHILFYLDLMIWSIACSFYLLLFFMWLGVILSDNTLWVKAMCPCIIRWFNSPLAIQVRMLCFVYCYKVTVWSSEILKLTFVLIWITGKVYTRH